MSLSDSVLGNDFYEGLTVSSFQGIFHQHDVRCFLSKMTELLDLKEVMTWEEAFVLRCNKSSIPYTI
jgi:hypothetical protein